MSSFEKLLQSYNYTFPAELIAQKPASPRDSAKLLVYDRATKTVLHATYKDLPHYLEPGSVLVLNQTKVLPARIEVTKSTGGKARLLYIKHSSKNATFLSDRPLTSGDTLSVNKKISFQVVKRDNQFYILKPNFSTTELWGILTKYGITPLPPYIKNSPLTGKKLLQEYNTVFAKELGSVAAPTASLHFTKQLLTAIRKAGVDIVYVTLHVSLGTFAPLTEQQWKSKKLHKEYYEIDTITAQKLNEAKKQGKKITAVGTTVVRTLESASNKTGKLTKLKGETSLFLTEHSQLHCVDNLITNFHVPKSSLLMLVSAFIGRKKLLALYQAAIKKHYRLFSFGDGMFIK